MVLVVGEMGGELAQVLVVMPISCFPPNLLELPYRLCRQPAIGRIEFEEFWNLNDINRKFMHSANVAIAVETIQDRRHVDMIKPIQFHLVAGQQDDIFAIIERNRRRAAPQHRKFLVSRWDVVQTHSGASAAFVEHFSAFICMVGRKLYREPVRLRRGQRGRPQKAINRRMTFEAVKLLFDVNRSGGFLKTAAVLLWFSFA